MSIKARLRRLEGESKDQRCQGCGLKPRQRGYIVVDGRDPAPEVPEVCPECGRGTRLHIRVVYEGDRGGGAIADAQMQRHKAIGR